MAARSSQDLACWRRAMARACWKQASAWAASGAAWRSSKVALEPIRLRQHVTLPAGLQHRQGLGQQAQPLLDLAGMPCGLGEQDQTERPRQRLPRGQDGRQALVHLRQARLALALHGQRPAPPACPMPHIERKPLRSRQGQEGLGLRLDRRHLAAAVMQVGRIVLGQRQT